MVVDTGPLILPLTREEGWEKVREVLAMHEEGEVVLHVGLFNVGELVSVTRRLGYDLDTSLRYATLVAERLSVVRDVSYAMWMGRLRVEASRLGYNVPWGDLSSVAAAVVLNVPVLALSRDKHFDVLAEVCVSYGASVQVIRVEDL